MAISKRTRFEVLRRCGFACFYCGVQVPDVVLEIDHVIPVTRAGTDDPWMRCSNALVDHYYEGMRAAAEWAPVPS